MSPSCQTASKIAAQTRISAPSRVEFAAAGRLFIPEYSLPAEFKERDTENSELGPGVPMCDLFRSAMRIFSQFSTLTPKNRHFSPNKSWKLAMMRMTTSFMERERERETGENSGTFFSPGHQKLLYINRELCPIHCAFLGQNPDREKRINKKGTRKGNPKNSANLPRLMYSSLSPGYSNLQHICIYVDCDTQGISYLLK